MTRNADFVQARHEASTLRMVAIADIDAQSIGGIGQLRLLIDSITTVGLLQPLLVRPHDGRYQIIAGRNRFAAAIAVGLDELPCFVHDVDQSRADQLADATNVRGSSVDSRPLPELAQTAIPHHATRELVEGLEVILSCLDLLGHARHTRHQRIARELIRLEASRLTLFAQALQILADPQPPILQRIEIGGLMAHAVERIEPGRRLCGLVPPEITIDVRQSLLGDEKLLSMVIAGAVAALQAMLETADADHLQVRVTSSPMPPTVSIEIQQSGVTLSPTYVAHAFDTTWTDRPGGYAAAVSLAAAQKVAQLHGGRVELEVGERAGCRLRFTLPAQLS